MTARVLSEASPPPTRLRQLWQRLRGGELSPLRAGASVGIGLFVGCLPLYGLHLPLCLALCLPLRLDAVVAYLAANISNPLVAPFLLTLEVEVGSLLLTGRHAAFDVERARQTGIAGFAAQAAVGSLLVGGVLGVAGAAAAAGLAARRRAARAPELVAAERRTIARYRAAGRGDRAYVVTKLASDPIVGALVALGELGDVLDAGAGRGQLGLLLLELGRLRSLHGVDWDQRKIEVARRAAQSDALFEVADLRTAELPPADTVLLLDVLHYMSAGEQRAALQRLAGSVRPGGRLVLRDVDRTRRGSLFGRLAERVAAALRYNRASQMEFRGAAAFLDELAAAGLACETLQHQAALGNVLIVARRPEAHSANVTSTSE